MCRRCFAGKRSRPSHPEARVTLQDVLSVRVCSSGARPTITTRHFVHSGKVTVPAHATGGDMVDDMGIFRTTLGIAALAAPERRRELFGVMVDTGSEYNWIPSEVLLELGVAPVRIDRFETADGRVLEREVGFALVYAGGRSAAAA